MSFKGKKCDVWEQPMGCLYQATHYDRYNSRSTTFQECRKPDNKKCIYKYMKKK